MSPRLVRAGRLPSRRARASQLPEICSTRALNSPWRVRRLLTTAQRLSTQARQSRVVSSIGLGPRALIRRNCSRGWLVDIQLSWNTLAARAVPKAGRVAKSAAEGNVCRLSAASDEVALVCARPAADSTITALISRQERLHDCGQYGGTGHPFDAQGLDWDSLAKLVDFHLQLEGTNAIVAVGTTGDRPRWTWKSTSRFPSRGRPGQGPHPGDSGQVPA